MKVEKIDIKKAGFSRPAGNFYAMQLSNYRVAKIFCMVFLFLRPQWTRSMKS